MFEMRFKIVEIRENGGIITHYLKGKPRDVKWTLWTLRKLLRNLRCLVKKE